MHPDGVQHMYVHCNETLKIVAVCGGKMKETLTSLMVFAVLTLLHVTLSSSSWLAALHSAKIAGRSRLDLFLQNLKQLYKWKFKEKINSNILHQCPFDFKCCHHGSG